MDCSDSISFGIWKAPRLITHDDRRISPRPEDLEHFVQRIEMVVEFKGFDIEPAADIGDRSSLKSFFLKQGVRRFQYFPWHRGVPQGMWVYGISPRTGSAPARRYTQIAPRCRPHLIILIERMSDNIIHCFPSPVLDCFNCVHHTCAAVYT